MRRLSLLIQLCFVCATALVAQTSYYETAEGLTTVELKRALHDLIQPQRTLSYGSGADHTWQGFWQTDRMADNQVCDRYSNELRYFNPEDTTASITGIDIEHVWAKSWFGGSLTVTPARDLFNLLPSDYSANRSKSNNPIGVVTQKPAGFDNGSAKRGTSTVTYPGETVNVWEPADKWKGDFARIYFYMATCYWDIKDEGGNSLWGEESLRTLDGSEWPTLLPNVYNLMLQWARQDPVDSIEIKRNEAVFRIQGNRNPYVDLPALSEYIWGTMVDSVFHADAVIVVPVDTADIEPEPDIADFIEDFETGTKGAYAEKSVVCTAAEWNMADALLGTLDNDRKNGVRSVRMKGGGSVEMTEDYAYGCDSLSFYAGLYGTDKGMTLSAYYSTDGGSNWQPVVEALDVSTWQSYAYHLDVEGTIRLRFVCGGSNTKRVNLDDVRMTHYVTEEIAMLKGDVNEDGQVTIADVTALVNIVLGKSTDFNAAIADVNEDGQVTIADVTALVNTVLGK
ncbi:MAG: endonuclease [Bacteroidaceae bacterium]|nr:endonuclease [Bacteroidaceae bacterium]